MMHSSRLFYCLLLLISVSLKSSCPETTPWSAPVKLSTAGNITSNVFSAATSAGFMAVWADSANNAQYSFSADGITWSTGSVSAAAGAVATNSDVFVAGNTTGFMVTWIDNANNGWSSFSTDNGATWSSAIRINPNSLTLDSNSDVFVGGSSVGFVATMIGNDENAYISFSTGTAAWSAPAQVSIGAIYNQNPNSQTTRGFVGVAVVGNSCMVTWITQLLSIDSAFFSSISPFSSTTVQPIVPVGFFESVPIVTARDGYFMTATRANESSDGVTIFSVATIATNWAVFSLLLNSPDNPDAGPWVAANQNGFMSVWVVGASQGSPGTPMWTFTRNNGFNFTPVCSILSTPSTMIGGPVGLSANTRGFVATWLDGNDSNAYASFFVTPISTTSGNQFVSLLEQKYGPLL